MPCIFVNPSTVIPYESSHFREMIDFYLFNCPARTFQTKKGTNKLPPKERYKDENYMFWRVSMRGQNFEDRGIVKAKLNSLRAAMFRTCDSGRVHYHYCSEENDIVDIALVPEEYRLNYVSEFIIRKGSSVNQTEGIFYAIRNSFAHGSFEVCKVVPAGKKRAITMYKLENINKGKTKAIIQLREKTLLNRIPLVNMPIEEIKRAGK